MQITTMSPFATSSRDPCLEHRDGKTFFICEARKKDNSWARSEVELDSFIGNEDGKFSVTGKDSNFTQSAQNIRLERGPGGRPVLCASLRNCNGEWRDAVAYPSDWLVNLEGRIAFGRPRDVRKFEVISDDRTFFICQTQRPDGSWGEAKIDLDKVIGNDDGKFDTSGGGASFTHSAKDIHMRYEGANNDIRPILVASLKNINGEWKVGEVDLLEVIKNVNGALEFHGRNHHGSQ